MQESLDNVKNSFKALINFKANMFLDSAGDATNVPLLFLDNKEKLNELFNDLLRYRRAITFQSHQLIQIKEKTNQLIEYLKSKYDFE